MKQIKYNLEKNSDIVEIYDFAVGNELDNIPFSTLQPDTNGRRIDAGNYYTQINDDDSKISIAVTNHSIGFITYVQNGDKKIYKTLLYDIFMHSIEFKYVENDLEGSTHVAKLYKNIDMGVEAEHQKISIDDVKSIIDLLYEEIAKYEGINEIINLDEFKENINKYLEGIRKR
ncbi:MAG: hypothetical protein IKX00_01065 [Bacilli bacterium]|nr:hypothetical protein [Bacilli bacterium]